MKVQPGALCWRCNEPAIGTCDFMRTALDRCSRAVCQQHGRAIWDGAQHICQEHDGLMKSVWRESDPNTKKGKMGHAPTLPEPEVS